MMKHIGWAARSVALMMVATGVVGCVADSSVEDPTTVGSLPTTPSGGEDLALGDVSISKTDGDWGDATTCKPIPEVEPLNAPMIVVSIDGLTLRLFDREGDYDRTFPTGVGSVDEETGESLTPTSDDQPGGVFWARADWPALNDTDDPETSPWAWNQSCRIWWQNPETDEYVPVFAGLPWIRLEGPPTLGYGIHGPIDGFTKPNGGNLRRGFVSHGCMRMAAEDIVEVFGRIQGHKVPVRIQKAPERRRGGKVVDVEDNWILSPCQEDADCRFDGGVCKKHAYNGEGFCTIPCTRYCPDKAGYPVSFCVSDPDAPEEGICTLKTHEMTDECRRYDHFVKNEAVPRFGEAPQVPTEPVIDPATGETVENPEPTVTRADVCLPGTEGWIGDRCMNDDECGAGRQCTPVEGGPEGLCTQACERFCPDQDGGYASTFCVDAPDSVPVEGGMCVARCVSDDDCPVGTACQATGRFNEAEVVRGACVPR